MIEKLLENWLDSASERSYQQVFVQMLSADGYKILHSTRHCLLEFGKDVLAIAPDGIGCAFQLKGDPKGRMTVNTFRREIQPQLVQLMAQSPSYSGFPSGPHRSYLVSNGQFEEEVQAAAREMNNSPYPSKLELWSRGHLLDACKRHAEKLWPSELDDNRNLLEIYLTNPREELPKDLLSGMLASILKISSEEGTLTKAELNRAAASATWITGISTSTFAESENHYASAIAWTICATSIIGAAEKHASGNHESVIESLNLSIKAIQDSLCTLWEEIEYRKNLWEGNPLVDADIYRWRIGALYGALSSLAIANASQKLLSDASLERLLNWLINSGEKPELWGEAATANLIPWLVLRLKQNKSQEAKNSIMDLARVLILGSQKESKITLASPYYDHSTVLRRGLGLYLDRRHQRIFDESLSGSSYTAEAVLQLLARLDIKHLCVELWPHFSKLTHHSINFSKPWNYCQLLASNGKNSSRIYPNLYTWDQLKNDSKQETPPHSVPLFLQNTPWLMSMWWQVAPYRLNSESCRSFLNALHI